MNCLEFRRRKLADPRRLNPEAAAHLAACAACRDFAIEVNENEERLAAALHVPVPEGLADRVILARKAGARFAPRLWALAASVVLSFGIGAHQWRDYRSPDYARLAIEHLLEEPESLTDMRIADPELLRQVVHNFGGTLEALPGRVRFMRLCPVPEGTGWHIVFETEYGLATLILVPRRMQAEVAHATVAGWNALARPAGQGHYAVIASSPEALAKVDALLRQRLRWRS